MFDYSPSPILEKGYKKVQYYTSVTILLKEKKDRWKIRNLQKKRTSLL